MGAQEAPVINARCTTSVTHAFPLLLAWVTKLNGGFMPNFLYSYLFHSFLIGLIPIIISIIIFTFLFRKIKCANPKNAKILLYLVVTYIALASVNFLTSFLPFGRYVNIYFQAPINIIQTCIPVILAVLIIRYIIPLHINKRDSLPDLSDGEVLNNYVKNILDSGHFFTALRSSLPKGIDDEKYGIDYIPYMLQNIQNRKDRFQKSARFWLFITALIGVVAALAILYSANILVNDDSAGMPRTLSRIENNLEQISKSVSIISPSYDNNKVFHELVGQSLVEFENFKLDETNQNRALYERILGIIHDAKNSGNIDLLLKIPESSGSEISAKTQNEKHFAEVFSVLQGKIARFLATREQVITNINTDLASIRELAPKVRENLEKPENRIPEILKRIALGVVVATFFLAILRYISRLYQMNYQQMLAADSDELFVMRFYVAFKSSATNVELRKAVLTEFMNGSKSGADFNMEGLKTNNDKSEINADYVRELFTALSKKL
jgi:hypothetical protein